MLRIVILAIALLALPATTSEADASCGQAFDIAAARGRWAATRKVNANSAQKADMCRAYGKQLFEAAQVRQATSVCQDGIKRQRDLDILDAQIDAFNNLIASQCSDS